MIFLRANKAFFKGLHSNQFSLFNMIKLSVFPLSNLSSLRIQTGSLLCTTSLDALKNIIFFRLNYIMGVWFSGLDRLTRTRSICRRHFCLSCVVWIFLFFFDSFDHCVISFSALCRRQQSYYYLRRQLMARMSRLDMPYQFITKYKLPFLKDIILWAKKLKLFFIAAQTKIKQQKED